MTDSNRDLSGRGFRPPYGARSSVSVDGLVQVGWMFSPDLAAEFDVTPLSDEYLITLEQAEQDGGIKDEFADRVIPVYRKADDA